MNHLAHWQDIKGTELNVDAVMLGWRAGELS